MKIRRVAAELCAGRRRDGQTDRHNEANSFFFRNISKARKNRVKLFLEIILSTENDAQRSVYTV